MHKLFIILSIIISSIYCNEKIFYTAKFKNINAGSAVLETKKSSNNEFIEIYFSLQTRKMIDMFYKLRDNINASILPTDYSLKKIKKISQQGKYQKIDEAEFDYENNLLKYNNKFSTIAGKIYDPLSIISYLRNHTLSIGNKFNFNVYSNGKIKKINLEVIKEETIRIKNKQYHCFVIGHTISNKSEIKFWIDKNTPKLPIIIETKGKNGDIVLKYKSHKLNNE